MDYTVHGILQVRILEWIAFPFSRGSSQPRDRTQIAHIAGRFFTSWATREAQEYWNGAYPFSTGSSPPRNHTGVSCITGRFFTNWALREARYIPLIKAQTQELKCFSLDIQGSIILSICKLSFKKYFPPLFPHTDLICLQFNEIYAHWIKIEESITLQHRKRSVSKRQLESDVSEHLRVAIKSRRMTALSLL